MNDGSIVTLDAAGAVCSVGLVRAGTIREWRSEGLREQLAALPAKAAELLTGAGAITMVAVTIGPGSFTGLRAALSLAHGIGLGLGCPVIGVTTGAAIEAAVGSEVQGRTVWIATDSRRGRVFLEHAGVIVSAALDALPAPQGRVAVAGDMAVAVASRWAARGHDVLLLAARRPAALGIAAAAQRTKPDRPLFAEPLYVDPPEARPPRSTTVC